MSEKFLLIDYENIQKVNIADVPEDTLVRIFVGQSQKNIPFELVQQAQIRGPRIEWIKIEGQGSNALDFHIAYYMGKLQTEHQAASFTILSKDKGFDPLLAHIKKLKGNCRRINSLFELCGVTANALNDQNLKRTIELLSKIDKSKRPRKRSTLSQHISSFFQKKLGVSEIDKIIDYLFIEGLVSETGGKLAYKF
ncbi:MAG: PIN domain-containing protein [Syntrophales bacterium]|nr:PIN domain-containing protein [Syntrophales bacterium]MDD5642763.1 PIN domain-containing protein [Syntrophales bacterium]